MSPTSYSVKSYWNGSGGSDFKSRVIEVSNDGPSWTEIDRRDNNDLSDALVTAKVAIAKVPGESFCFFCLRQTGQNHLRLYLLLRLTLCEK